MSTNAGLPEDRAAAAGNPYYRPPAEVPTSEGLDAGAPSLGAVHAQQLNKRALWFLLGIAVLVLSAAFLLFGGRSRSAKEGRAEPRKERVEVPAGPAVPPLPVDETPPTPPIPVVASSGGPPLPPMPEPPAEPADVYPVVRPPSLLDRRMMAGAPEAQSFAEPDTSPAQQELRSLTATLATSAVYLHRPDTLLMRGSYIRCALETRIVTDVDGFTSCVVTEPVYSFNGRRLLVPKGSKVMGQYGNGAIRGARVAVVWDRLVTPAGIDVSMASPGVDNLGSAGHPGDRDEHWAGRIGSALFISLLSDAFKYLGESEGPNTTTSYPGTGAVVQEPFRSNTARTVERLANQALESGASRPPTVTINQGAIVNVYVSQDVDFSGVLQE